MLIYNANGPSGYNIANSLRFRSSASAYLNRTPGSAGNRKTWTLSLWNKGGNVSTADYYILSTGGTSTERFTFTINGNSGAIQIVQVVGGVVKLNKQTTSVYRDPSAWYHIVLSVDTTQATPAVNLYVNGVQVTAFSTNTNTLAQNDNTQVNNTNPHYLGKALTADYLDGYMADINFIDGQALTPSSFGQTNPVTGVWQPIAYAGTYGTNGFHLSFSNGTSTTTLGYDSSGNSNNWTTNNISLTSGSTYDWMIDSPTSFAGTSYGVGNYCVWNPINNNNTNTLTNGNLSGSNNGGTYATMGASSGKYYWEYQWTSGTSIAMGVSPMNRNIYFSNAGSGAACYFDDGQKSVDGTNSSYGSSYTTSDVIGVALDTSAGTITFYKNNVSQGAFSLPSGVTQWTPSIWSRSGTVGFTGNFGQRPFAYTPPTGYKSLCTYNLPAASIVNGASYMAATTYTGTNANQSIVNTVNGAGFQPDLVWIKDRSRATDHALFDTVRGTGYSLRSNTTGAEQIPSPNDGLTAFNPNGFSLGANNNSGCPDINYTVGNSYVGWQWKANGAAVSNTAGSITSQVSANTTAGFSVVTYTGTGANATVGHGLGVAPAMIIVKARTGGATTWIVYHQNMSASPQQGYLALQSTGAYAALSTVWNDTAPTSSVFTVGTNASTGASTINYVAYCFAAIPGYSAFGSYTGNGSTDGPFVFTNFRPRYVMVKCSSTTAAWIVMDTARSPYNATNVWLNPDQSTAENSTTEFFDILSNGFKLRYSGANNASGQTFIYAAFAENPFQNALAR